MINLSWKALKLSKYPLFTQILLSAFRLHLREGESAAIEIPTKKEKVIIVMHLQKEGKKHFGLAPDEL